MLCPVAMLSVLLLLANVQSPSAKTGGDWTALPTPRLCESREVEPAPAPLTGGSHVLHPTDGPSLKTAASPARFPLPSFTKLLEDEAGRGSRLEVFRSSPSLLVRGDPAAVEACLLYTSPSPRDS